MKPALLILLLLLSGCTAPAGWSLLRPGSWFQGMAAAKVEKIEAKQSQLEGDAVKLAQVEVLKTGVLLEAAKTENPQSNPVKQAARTNENAAQILNQREPLAANVVKDAIQVARDLLSDETKRRQAAEDAQASAERHINAVSRELAEVSAALKAQTAKAQAEAV